MRMPVDLPLNLVVLARFFQQQQTSVAAALKVATLSLSSPENHESTAAQVQCMPSHNSPSAVQQQSSHQIASWLLPEG